MYLYIYIHIDWYRTSRVFKRIPQLEWQRHTALMHYWFPIQNMHLAYKKNVNRHNIDWLMERNTKFIVKNYVNDFFKQQNLIWKIFNWENIKPVPVGYVEKIKAIYFCFTFVICGKFEKKYWFIEFKNGNIFYVSCYEISVTYSIQRLYISHCPIVHFTWICVLIREKS